MAADAAAFVEADRVIHTQGIEAVRVALTAEQVGRYELPTAPAKSTDSRTKRWEGDTCQLEALDPSTLANVVEAAIEEWLDLDAYGEELDRERRDRAELLALPRGSE